MILLMLPVCFFVSSMGQADYGQIFTGILSLLLYGAGLISFCLLINETVQNRTAAFVVSALFLAVFNSIHMVPLYVTLPSAISSFFRLLSFAWHFDAASKGIADTRDIFWFILTTIIFLYITYFIQELKRGRIYNKKEKAFYLGIPAVIILLLLNSTAYFLRLDFSQNKSYSVSAYTKKLTNVLDDRLNITYYRSGSLSKLYPQIRDVTDFLNSYALTNKKITCTIKDPDKDEAIQAIKDSIG